MILKTKKYTYKVLALFTLLTFSATNGWAMPGLGIEVAVPRETPAFLQIEIPSDIASIEEVYEAPATEHPKLILHVQNIHGNYESQVKIKKLLEYLYDKYGFKLIFAEGAVDKLDPDLLRLYPDAERNLKLADSMAKTGELTGIEYFLMDGPKDVEAVGIEETQLYRKDYQAFRKVYAVKDESDAYLTLFEGKLETLASRIFSPNTRRLLSEWRKFEDGHRDFLPYVKRLTVDAKSVLGLDLESLFAQVEWPQITRLLALQTMEKDLDENAAMKEKERLLKFLTEQQISPEIGEAIQKLHEKKITVTRTDDAEKRLEDLPRYLFERLAREAGPKGFRFHDYPAFSLWAGHLILQNELDSKLLFEEIDKVFTKVLDEMTVSEREKNLMELYRDEVLLKKLLHLELTRKEWERVVYRKDWIDLRPMVGRLKKLSEEYDAGKEPADIWAKLGENVENSQVEAVHHAVETGFQFYDLARQRENVFYNTISNEMESKNIDKAVVVTGGFHTEGLMDIFREKEINCSILMPRIAGDLSSDAYISSMMENKPVMFDLATIENIPHMSLLMQQMAQHSDVENPKDRAYAVARVLQAYIQNYGQVDSLDALKRDLDNFNVGPFAAQNNANIRLELAQNGSQNIWIRYQGNLLSAGGTIVEIPFAIEDGKVTVKDHTEAGPKTETLPADVMNHPEETLAGAGPRYEIRAGISRREALSRLGFLGGMAFLFPDIVTGQATEAEGAAQKKKDPVQITRIMNMAKYYSLTLDATASDYAEKFTNVNAESDLVYGKDVNAILTDFSWRALIMSIAKQLKDEGFTTDRVLTQEQIGIISAELQKNFNIPPPMAIKIGDDKEKQRAAKDVIPGAGRKKAADNIKEQKKLALLNFQSLLQPTIDHDELISQTARALVKFWLAPEDSRKTLFKDVPKDKAPNDDDSVIEKNNKYESLIAETFFFIKGIPNTEAEKKAYAKILMDWAENIVKINEVASTSKIPKTKAIYDSKNYYPGEERLIYRFTEEDALALVNSWAAQNNKINFSGILERLVLLKINYDQAERVTVDIVKSAFNGESAPQKALLEKVGAKADVPELQNVILELVPNTELEQILKLLPATEKELADSAEKRKFYEGLKAAVAGDDWKVLGRFLRENKIDSDLLFLKLNVTYRKGKRNARGERETPSFAQFFKDIKAATAKDFKEVRKTFEGYRFSLIQKGELARMTSVYETAARNLSNEYRKSIGALSLNTKDRRVLTTDENLVLIADAYRNQPANDEADMAANFLINNGNLVGKYTSFEQIYSHVFGPGYADFFGAARSRALETLLAINPAVIEGLDVHILSSKSQFASKDILRQSMDAVIDRALHKTEESYDRNDPELPKKAAAVKARLQKIVDTAPKVRREIREAALPLAVVTNENVQFSIGDSGDGVIAGQTLTTRIGQFTDSRLMAYIGRSESADGLKLLLEALNSQDLKAEVDSKVDPAALDSVHANLEKFAGILSQILKKAEETARPAKVSQPASAPKAEPEIVSEEEMAEAVRAGIDTLRHFLSLAADQLDMEPEVMVALIAGGILRDPVISQVRAINRRLTGGNTQTSSMGNAPSLQKLAVTDHAVSLITVVQMSQFSQSDLLDPEKGLLASVELLLRANPKSAISLVLVDDNATITDELLSNINLNVNTLQTALGKETRLRVVRSSSDDKTLKRTLETVRRQMMMGRIKTTGIRMTQMGFMDKDYAELFATNTAADEQFGEWVRNNASPMADPDKIFGARLKKEPALDLLAGMLFGLLRASRTSTNAAEIAAKAEALKYDLAQVKKEFGYEDITEALSGIIGEIMASIRSEIRTSQAA